MKRNILFILMTCAWCFSGAAQAKVWWSEDYLCQRLIAVNFWKASHVDLERLGAYDQYSEFNMNVRAGVPSEDDCKKILGLKVQESISVPKEKPAIQTSNNSEPPTSLDANYLCKFALKGDFKEWDLTKPFEDNVREAKLRGLSVDGCRQALGLPPLTSQADSNSSASNLFAKDVLCKRALNASLTNWTDGVNEKEVAEAKQRGLSVDDCRREIGMAPLTTQTSDSSSALTNLAANVLCTAALNRLANDWDLAFEIKVQEAKRRGLSVDDCRKALGLAPTQLSSVQTLETRQTLDDVESYLKTGSYSLDPLILVEKLTAVKTALNSNDLNELTRLRDDLKAYVETDAGYQKFLQNRVEAAKEAEKLLADKTLESAKQLISLSEDFVRKNVLSEKAPILVPLIKTLKSALSDGAIPKIGEASTQLEQQLKSFGIDVPVMLQASTTPVEPQQAPTIEVATPKKAEPVPVTETSDTKIVSLEPANPPPVEEPQQPLKRVALVIGNDTYQSVPPLENAGRDAKIIASALTDIGFSKVTLLSNLDHTAMLNALKSFSDEAELADWAMIYYAGHGIEVGGVNYLIPTDAVLKRDRDVDIEAIDLAKVMSVTEGARKLRVVILDACRDNPFVKQMARTVASRSIGRGLGQVEPEAGSLVVYAAKHGQVAYDGDTGMNGPFAASLVKRLKTPKLDIRRMFDLVRDDVLNLTGKKQQPFIYGSLSGNEDFYFSVK